MSDAYFSQVSLLLHGNGPNGSTTFTDNSSSPKTIAVLGNAQISTAQSKWGGASMSFDGAGDYLNITTSTDFDFALGDYTVEFWFYPNSVTTLQTLMSRYTSWATSAEFYLELQATGFIRYRAGNNVPISLSTTTALTLGSWYHVAITCQSGTTRLFLNGTIEASTVTTATLSSASPLGIGYELSGGTAYLNGYLDDIRITKGVARYTANFSPPTDEFPNRDPVTGGRTLFSDLTSSQNPFRLSGMAALSNNGERLFNDVLSVEDLFRVIGSNAVPNSNKNWYADASPTQWPNATPFWTSSPLATVGSPSIDQSRQVRFPSWGGGYKIVGKVQIDTVNTASKWVYIFPQTAPSVCIGAQFTDSSGSFSFMNLANAKYAVYAMDPIFSYNGKLFENIQSVTQ